MFLRPLHQYVKTVKGFFVACLPKKVQMNSQKTLHLEAPMDSFAHNLIQRFVLQT